MTSEVRDLEEMALWSVFAATWLEASHDSERSPHQIIAAAETAWRDGARDRWMQWIKPRASIPSDWRCPDCGSGITKVHVADGGVTPCGKPPGYWSRPSVRRDEQAVEKAARAIYAATRAYSTRWEALQESQSFMEDGNREWWREVARAAVSAYLAAVGRDDE